MRIDKNHFGAERRDNAGRRGGDDIHPLRWRFLTIWIILFTFIAFWLIRDDRNLAQKSNDQIKANGTQIRELKKTKASVARLEKTDCGLRDFLLDARATRLKLAAHEHGKRRKIDLEAAAGYKSLADRFSADSCHRRGGK